MNNSHIYQNSQDEETKLKLKKLADKFTNIASYSSDERDFQGETESYIINATIETDDDFLFSICSKKTLEVLYSRSTDEVYYTNDLAFYTSDIKELFDLYVEQAIDIQYRKGQDAIENINSQAMLEVTPYENYCEIYNTKMFHKYLSEELFNSNPQLLTIGQSFVEIAESQPEKDGQKIFSGETDNYKIVASSDGNIRIWDKNDENLIYSQQNDVIEVNQISNKDIIDLYLMNINEQRKYRPVEANIKPIDKGTIELSSVKQKMISAFYESTRNQGINECFKIQNLLIETENNQLNIYKEANQFSDPKNIDTSTSNLIKYERIFEHLYDLKEPEIDSITEKECAIVRDYFNGKIELENKKSDFIASDLMKLAQEVVKNSPNQSFTYDSYIYSINASPDKIEIASSRYDDMTFAQKDTIFLKINGEIQSNYMGSEDNQFISNLAVYQPFKSAYKAFVKQEQSKLVQRFNNLDSKESLEEGLLIDTLIKSDIKVGWYGDEKLLEKGLETRHSIAYIVDSLTNDKTLGEGTRTFKVENDDYSVIVQDDEKSRIWNKKTDELVYSQDSFQSVQIDKLNNDERDFVRKLALISRKQLEDNFDRQQESIKKDMQNSVNQSQQRGRGGR